MSLRELRQKRGLTQKQLADRVDGVNQQRIAAWETGARNLGDASFNVVIKVADALKVSNPRKLLEAPSEPEESDSK